MSTRILANDNEDAGETGAILFCGTTGRAYGQVFDSYEQADAFCRWAVKTTDVRDPIQLLSVQGLDLFAEKYSEFLDLWEFCGLTTEQKFRYKDLLVRCIGSSGRVSRQDKDHLRSLERIITLARVEEFGESE